MSLVHDVGHFHGKKSIHKRAGSQKRMLHSTLEQMNTKKRHSRCNSLRNKHR